MKTNSDSVKNFLNFSHRVLGVSQIYQSQLNASVTAMELDTKKIFNFYLWPQVCQSNFESSTIETHSIQTVFIFLTTVADFENRLKSQTDMISKMNQALGGQDANLLVGWLSPNSEVDFFSSISSSFRSLRIVLFRDDVDSKSLIYPSGSHTILETKSPLNNPNDLERKRFVWNDFKKLLAST